MDGTVIETVKRVAELSWTPKTDGKHLSAYWLHTHFEVLCGKPDATPGIGKGDGDERAVLEKTAEADRCYQLDWGYVRPRSEHPVRLICVEIQAYCGTIVSMLILISTGQKPNRAIEQKVWYSLIGLAGLKELEAFIKTGK